MICTCPKHRTKHAAAEQRLKQQNVRNAQAYAQDIWNAEEHMRKAWERTRELEDVIVRAVSVSRLTVEMMEEHEKIQRKRAAEDPMLVESVWAERERRNGHLCGLQGFGRGGPEALNDTCPACEAGERERKNARGK